MSGHVLITGANRGLGYELLKVFHANNYVVFPLIRNNTALQRIREEFGERCYPIEGDVSLDSCKKSIESTIKKYTNKIDILINNAGIPGVEHQIDKVNTSEVYDLFNVHCLGIIRTVQATLPFLLNSSNPRIINVSSRLGSLSKMASGEFKDRQFSYSYRIAKAAQNMLSICLHNELNSKGVHVSAVHPGRLKTDSGSSDADMEASEAAEFIFKWIQTLNKENSCQYVQPFVTELKW
jgi:NAD(P)-dependent dehydrogenase (short-subunit alcohol dehydrogenase family)